MAKLIITVGAQLDYVGNRVSQPETKRDQVMRKLSHQFGGCTVNEHIGSWVDDYGTLIQEKGYTFTVLTNELNDHLANDMAQLVRLTFNQHTVVMEHNGKAYFVADESEYFTNTQGGI